MFNLTESGTFNFDFNEKIMLLITSRNTSQKIKIIVLFLLVEVNYYLVYGP